MYSDINIEKILFLDIETVSQYAEYDVLSEQIKALWDKKAASLMRYETHEDFNSPKDLYSRAGIYAEFGKVVCISVGFIRDNKLYLKSYCEDNEKTILSQFASLVNGHFNNKENHFCGHNIKEFDIPYLCRRMLVNGIEIPKIMNLMGKKTWENPHIDTMEMWKFGDFKHYTPLDLLANIFEIPSPKDDIDGSEVGMVYWNEKDLKRIATYCEKDTATVAQLFLKMTGKEIISQENIIKK